MEGGEGGGMNSTFLIHRPAGYTLPHGDDPGTPGQPPIDTVMLSPELEKTAEPRAGRARR